jgi:hypothetical protein
MGVLPLACAALVVAMVAARVPLPVPPPRVSRWEGFVVHLSATLGDSLHTVHVVCSTHCMTTAALRRSVVQYIIVLESSRGNCFRSYTHRSLILIFTVQHLRFD